MFKILLMSLFLLPQVQAADCDKHPIYCQIKKNAPKLKKKKAMHLSNVIYKTSRKYKLPTRIFVAILAQESSYNLGAKGCHKGLAKQEAKDYRIAHYYEPYTEFKKEKRYELVEVKICSDFGIGQIYFKTAKGFGFDIKLLTTDLEYSIDASAQVLADFQKRYSAKEVDWWTRYNARSKIKRQIYKTLVERYF